MYCDMACRDSWVKRGMSVARQERAERGGKRGRGRNRVGGQCVCSRTRTLDHAGVPLASGRPRSESVALGATARLYPYTVADPDTTASVGHCMNATPVKACR